MLTPPRMIRSFSRPVRRRNPSASSRPRSPVRMRPRLLDRHAAVLGEIAVVVIGKAADLDLADLARGSRRPSRVDDREVVIGEAAARPCRAAAARRGSPRSSRSRSIRSPVRSECRNAASNRRHSSTVSGAELEVRKRSDGRLSRCASPSPLSRMLIVVGLPAATVTRCSRTCWKKRLAENFSAITSVAPRLTGTSAPSSCAEAQLNERKS